jgi:hypothetical protein
MAYNLCQQWRKRRGVTATLACGVSRKKYERHLA